MSLDGFIAREDGDIDWLMDVPNPEKSDFGFKEFIKHIDALVMGNNTFEKVLSFGEWPYQKPVFVVSNSLETVPDNLKDKVELIKGEPEKIVNILNSRNFNNLYIDGGKTIQEFLKHELIDELIISTIPILLGKGIPLFTELLTDQKFEHIKTEVYNDTIVKSHYKKLIA